MPSKKKPEVSTIDVTVMVEDHRKSDLAGVARDLAAKGFILGQSLHEIGVLTGRAPATALAALAKVSGVSAVEESRSDYHTQAE